MQVDLYLFQQKTDRWKLSINFPKHDIITQPSRGDVVSSASETNVYSLSLQIKTSMKHKYKPHKWKSWRRYYYVVLEGPIRYSGSIYGPSRECCESKLRARHPRLVFLSMNPHREHVPTMRTINIWFLLGD